MLTRTRLIMLTGFCLTMFSWPLPALFAAEGATTMPALDTQGIIRASKATQGEPDKEAENKPDTETGDEASENEENAAPAVIVPDNIWYGLDQTSASGLIRSMPDRFAAPVYFHIFKDLLITDAAPFGTPQDEVTAEEDTAPSSKKRSSRVRDRKSRQAQNSSVFDGDLPQPAALSATIEAAPYDFLLLRLETLYRIGAFEDAERLYKTLFPQLPEDERLAVHGLNILLAKGRLAAACLDVQTMESRFNQAAFWLDFNQFCARHYETDDDMAAQTVTAIAENVASDDDDDADTGAGTGTGEDNTEVNGASTADSAIGMTPVVDDKDGDDAVAAGDPAGESDAQSAAAPVRKRSGIAAQNFAMFPYFSAILDGQVTPQMLVRMSLTERLMAHAAKAVPFKAVLAHYKNDVTSVPSEILKILILQDEKANAHHACVAQEGFARGIISSRSLTLLMRSLEFAEASFKDGSMARHSLHPCWKPAWYMQWIEKADDDAQKTIRARQTFDYISKNYPALIDGFEQYFVDLDPVSLGADSWTAAASIIRTQGSLPENWVARWKSVHPQTAKTSGDAKDETESNGASEQNNPQNHDADAAAQAEQNGIHGENGNGRGVSTPVTSGDPALDNAPETANNAGNSGSSNHADGLAPYWYFLSLQDPSSFTAESYIAWVRQWSPKLPLVAQKDPARTLSLLKNVLELEKYEEAVKLCYEKFFSLTFYRNYVISSYSLTGRAFAANQSSRFGEAVLLYLHVLASQSPSNTYPEYLSGMVDILYKAGYQEHAKNIIVSTLSVGKD